MVKVSPVLYISPTVIISPNSYTENSASPDSDCWNIKPYDTPVS